MRCKSQVAPPAVSTKRRDGVLRCKSKREKIAPPFAWPDHLKKCINSCENATIKLKDDLYRRAKGASEELKYVEKGRE
jgi:hypothetical protein